MNLQTIQQLRDRKYSSPPLKIEKVFFEKDEYIAYLASYISDGLKIYGFLTVPKQKSFGVVVFCRGYLEKEGYATDRQYVRYVDYLAKAGYVVFKSDYRGYGDSEGSEETIFEAGYAIDVLNAIEAIKNSFVIARRHDEAIPFEIATLLKVARNDVFMWGHSLGGDITLKVLEVRSDIKAASIWSAPTATYDKLIKRWQDRGERIELINQLISELGGPDENMQIYKQYSPSSNLQYINAPIQLLHGKEDDKVPTLDSENLAGELKRLGKDVEIKMIKGNHNLTDNLDEAMQETIKFFQNV